MNVHDPHGTSQVIDRADLARRTFGDEDLARELLDLFEAQCARLRPALAGGAARVRADALHTLRGAALAVGAERVAQLAAAMEEGGEATPDEFATLVQALDDVVNVIRSGRGASA